VGIEEIAHLYVVKIASGENAGYDSPNPEP
jgi:hypothetical protein